MSHRALASCLASFVLVLPLGFAGPAIWTPILEDQFDREMIGPDWHVLRGDWRIEKGSLRVTRVWPSDNNLMCTRVMPRGDMRALVSLRLEDSCSIRLGLRTGEFSWGGGGYPDAFQVILRSNRDETPLTEGKGGLINIGPDTDYAVEMVIENGKGRVAINGRKVVEKDVPAERSEVNRQFYMNCMPNGWVHSVKLYSRAGQSLALPLESNSRKENKRATVYAEKLIDPGNPALGMQKAIDSLPPNGGVVILPAGEFLMRRHLGLRGGVTLRGQGYDKTALKHAPIHQTKIARMEQQDALCFVTVEDASPFRVGDAVCFGGNWSHVGGSDVNQPGRDHVITAIEGNVLTVRGRAPENAKSVKNFFPLVFCVVAEYAEVKDLTLRGPESGPGGGGFNTCPVSFGCLYGARIHRVNIEGFPADGVSVQLAGDALVTDNTVTGTGYGFHPGTQTQRFLWARNHSVGNSLGLYFCFSNENGVYYKNTLDNFGGYPGVGDVFNLLNCNDLKKGMGIGGAYAGLFFNNKMESLVLSGCPPDPGRPLYFGPSHYYVVAEHRLGKLSIGESTKGLVIAGNAGLAHDTPLTVEGKAGDSVYAKEGLGLARKLGLEPGAGRDKPVPAPVLREPVLDGRTYYSRRKPDCGFQRALDELAREGGGTLQLPGGRYALRTPLRLSTGVTLAGHGVGTVLHPGDGHTGSLIVGEHLTESQVRSLTILSRYDPAAGRAPAIAFSTAMGVRIEGVDIRGWEGVGIQVRMVEDLFVRDCRVIGCKGDGYRLSGGPARVDFSLAKSCGRGFVLEKIGKSTRVEGCIARSNRGTGIELKKVWNPIVTSNNVGYNDEDGILLTDVTDGHIIANLCRSNNQALKDRGGIRLAGSSSGCTLAYNHCSDDEIYASQAHGIIEEKTALRNTIRFNLACPMFMNHQPGGRPAPAAILSAGSGSTVTDNQARSVLPSGSSIESFALGFNEHPHRIHMRRGRLKQDQKQAQSRLDYVTKLIDSATQRGQTLQKQIAELKKKPDANAAKLKQLEGQRQRYESDAQKQAKACEVWKAKLAVPTLWLQMMDQETTVRIAKFAPMKAHWDSAPAPRIKQAEDATKKAEDELARLRSALKQAQERVAEKEKKK